MRSRIQKMNCSAWTAVSMSLHQQDLNRTTPMWDFLPCGVWFDLFSQKFYQNLLKMAPPNQTMFFFSLVLLHREDHNTSRQAKDDFRTKNFGTHSGLFWSFLEPLFRVFSKQQQATVISHLAILNQDITCMNTLFPFWGASWKVLADFHHACLPSTTRISSHIFPHACSNWFSIPIDESQEASKGAEKKESWCSEKEMTWLSFFLSTVFLAINLSIWVRQKPDLDHGLVCSFASPSVFP